MLLGLRRTLGQDLLHLALRRLGVVRLHLQPITAKYNQPMTGQYLTSCTTATLFSVLLILS